MSSENCPKEKNKLWLPDLSLEISDADLVAHLRKFGDFISIKRTDDKRFTFLTYASEEAAAEALKKFRNAEYKVHYANARTNQSNGMTSILKSSSQQSEQIFSNSERRVQFSNGNGSSSSSPKASFKGPKPVFENESLVVITHVTDKLEFYAYLKSQHDAYVYLIDTVSELAEYADAMKGGPRVDSLVFAAHEGRFWRAVVQKTAMDDIATVKLIDVGVVLKIPFKHLKTIHKEFYDYEIELIGSFFLNGIDECKVSTDTVVSFKSFVGSTLKMISNQSIVNPGSNVNLMDPKNNQIINPLLKQFAKSFTYEKLKKPWIPFGKHQELKLVDSSNLKSGFNRITFIHNKDAEEFEQQCEDIDELGKSYEHHLAYEPEPDEVFLVKHDNHWYRGTLYGDTLDTTIDSDRREAIIYLVDYYKSIQTKLKDVRKILDEDLGTRKTISFVASVDGYGTKIDEADAEQLLKKIYETDIIICEVRGSTSELEKRVYIKF